MFGILRRPEEFRDVSILDCLGRPRLWSDLAFWKIAYSPTSWASLITCPDVSLGMVFSGHIDVLRDTPYATYAFMVY
jgi:hypothetical protein